MPHIVIRAKLEPYSTDQALYAFDVHLILCRRVTQPKEGSHGKA